MSPVQPPEPDQGTETARDGLSLARSLRAWHVLPASHRTMYARRAADMLEAIDKLHQPDPEDGYWCFGCDFPWPCRTTRILHPKDGAA